MLSFTHVKRFSCVEDFFMKKIMWMICSVLLVLVIAFCVSKIVSGKDNQDRMALEHYYDSLEKEYIAQVRSVLKEFGYEYSGLNLTKVVTDQERSYDMVIHDQRFEYLTEKYEDTLLGKLKFIEMDQGESIIMISLVYR